MTQSISKSNAILAAKIGIQQIEVLQANNTISRMVRGAISARERIALLPINLASFERILEQMVLAYLDAGKVVVNKCPALLTNHHNAMTKILKSFILDSPSELQEANKKSIVARIFPGIPKDLVMDIIHGKSIPVRLLQKMQKNGLSTSSVAKLASIENDPIKKKQLVSQYFHKLKTSAYTLTRTNISEMTSLINKEVYGAIPRDLVGYQVHGIMDDRIRPEHRARNGTIYYRVPRYGNPGLDKMPNPPLEADGSHAWNCRCVTGECRVDGYVKSISRFLYDGEFTKIRTAGGAEITVTSNHPIATRFGLVQANMISEGDDIITNPNGVSNFSVNVKNKVPTIKDVFESILVNGGRFASFDLPKSLDFHGDGKFAKGKIDIVFADNKLMAKGDSTPVHFTHKDGLVLAETVEMSVPDLPSTRIVSHPKPFGSFRRRLASGLNSSLNKSSQKAERLTLVRSSPSNTTPANSVFLGEAIQGFTRNIPRNKIRRWFFKLGNPRCFRFSPNFDPKAGEPSSHSIAFDSNFSSYLLKRYSRKISLDKVVEITRFHKKELVYSVDSHNGYYMASDNNIAILNGNCWITPILSTDPKKFYDYKGRIIPDAKTFSNWFGASPKSKQVLAVGVRRHQEASKRLKPGETLQWHHLLDPKTGMLMDANEIRAETITKRSGRIRSIKSKITKIPT